MKFFFIIMNQVLASWSAFVIAMNKVDSINIHCWNLMTWSSDLILYYFQNNKIKFHFNWSYFYFTSANFALFTFCKLLFWLKLELWWKGSRSHLMNDQFYTSTESRLNSRTNFLFSAKLRIFFANHIKFESIKCWCSARSLFPFV